MYWRTEIKEIEFQWFGLILPDLLGLKSKAPEQTNGDAILEAVSPLLEAGDVQRMGFDLISCILEPHVPHISTRPP